jgi:hypothetical protein
MFSIASRKITFDGSPSFRIVIIPFGQGPDRVEVVRKEAEGIDLDWVIGTYTGYRFSKT